MKGKEKSSHARVTRREDREGQRERERVKELPLRTRSTKNTYRTERNDAHHSPLESQLPPTAATLRAAPAFPPPPRRAAIHSVRSRHRASGRGTCCPLPPSRAEPRGTRRALLPFLLARPPIIPLAPSSSSFDGYSSVTSRTHAGITFVFDQRPYEGDLGN